MSELPNDDRGLILPAPAADAAVGPSTRAGWFATTFAALSIPNYRYFMIGQGISLAGTWMRRTAMGWLVYQVTKSEALLGLVMGLALLPMFILSPLAGALADRMDKRRIIMQSQVVSLVSTAGLAIGVLTGTISMGWIMALAVIGGAAFAFEVPARQAFVVDLVGREHLLNAIALNSGLVNLARIVGPALAGQLIAEGDRLLAFAAPRLGLQPTEAFTMRFGTGFVFVLDAISYLVVMGTLAVLRLRPREMAPVHTSHIDHIVEGMRECWRNTRVRTMLLLLFLNGIFGWGFQTLLPALAQGTLHFDASQYGRLMSSFGVGAIGGAIFTARSRSEKLRRTQAFLGVWIMSAGLMAMTFTRAFWPMCATMMVGGFGAILFISTANTRIQLSVRDSIRGRVMGIWALGFGGSLPLGSLLIGQLAEVIQPFPALRVFIVIMAAGSAALFFGGSRRRLLRMRKAGVFRASESGLRSRFSGEHAIVRQRETVKRDR